MIKEPIMDMAKPTEMTCPDGTKKMYYPYGQNPCRQEFVLQEEILKPIDKTVKTEVKKEEQKPIEKIAEKPFSKKLLGANPERNTLLFTVLGTAVGVLSSKKLKTTRLMGGIIGASVVVGFITILKFVESKKQEDEK